MKQLLVIFFLFLSLLCGCTTDADRSRMRSGLDSINQRNRNDQPFTVADVQPYADFFDRHGTSNDRLLAHYLVGRAYYDAGEAPMALQCYQQAIECADTTAKDCDFAQLSRVYAQMAEVFYYQGLYRHQLASDANAVKYAWLGKDTIAALMSYEQEAFAYEALGLLDSAIITAEHVAEQYEQLGCSSDAAITLGTIILPLVNKGDYQRAKAYIDRYDYESGLFDSVGNVKEGHEIYYKAKGLYFLYTNELDSAKHYFYKEMADGKDFNNQNSAAIGLALLYQRIHRNDSALKYSMYAYSMNDSLFSHMATDAVGRIQSIYNYSRHQEIAFKESEKAAKEKFRRNVIAMMLFLFLISASIIVYRLKAEKKKEHLQYMYNLEQLEQTQSEVIQLREHADEYEELISEKERILEEQRQEIQEHRKQIILDHATIDMQLQNSIIYQRLSTRKKVEKLTMDELRECRRLIIEFLPEFNNLLLIKEYKLNKTDYNVCVLFRLGFKSKETSNMLGISQARVSQISAKMLKNLFNVDNGGASELIDLLHAIY